MTTVAVIPARFASSRFPGKPLAKETGKYLIQHVCERVGECSAIDRVVVATDDQRIAEAVASFGGAVCMTRTDHSTGTDRIAEAADLLSLADGDLVVNVQGDEPEIHPADLEKVIGLHDSSQIDVPGGRGGSGACEIGTLAVPFSEDGPCAGPGSPDDPNCVKVVVSTSGEALYFSRSLIPYPRKPAGIVTDPTAYRLHLGVYTYTVAALKEITSARPTALETTESLEQLRWLEMGKRIKVATAEHRMIGIDTPQEYEAFVQRVRSAHPQVPASG